MVPEEVCSFTKTCKSNYFKSFNQSKSIQEINDGKKREIKPICVLENGAVYQGEWLMDENQKDGRGV